MWMEASDRRDLALHLVVVLGCLILYVPFCGSYGLWDPWEGHYAEVARQMSVRGDWISLWWPGGLDRAEFWSKPVFTFWVEALMFRLFGLASPSSPAGQVALSHATEWACRLPMTLFGTLGVWSVFYATARLIGRRAGILAAIICATAPMYFFISRQAITDMPFVGPMTAALCIGAVALFAEDRELGRRKLWRLCVPTAPLFWIALVLLVIFTLPQFIYDSVALRVVLPLGRRRVVLAGIVAMAPYIALWIWLLWRLTRAKYRSQLLLVIAYILVAIAGLAKGLVGVGLPGLVLLGYLAFARDWRQLRRMDVLTGILVIVVVAFPWYHAMLIRHGLPFWNELFGDNHWRRLVIGRHGDRGGFVYYLRELGFGLFPWTAIAAVAVPAAFAAARPSTPRGRFLLFIGLWALFAYAIVTISMTKFHHYILPAVPAIAILCAWFLDELITGGLVRAPSMITLFLFGVPLLAYVTWNLVATQQSPQQLLWLFDYDYINNPRGRTWPASLDYRAWIVTFAVIAAVASIASTWKRASRPGVVVLCACALVCTAFALDKVIPELSPHWSQKHLLATYFQMKQPGDRIVAWNMFWRSETFYSENELFDPRLPPDEKSVFAFDNADRNFQAWMGRHSGKRVFFLFEAGRLNQLRTMLPEAARSTLSVADHSNNKFLLAVAQL